MAEKRKSPLLRKLVGALPSKLRFALMRDQLKVSHELDARFTFRIARTQEELSEAYRILQDSYLEMGYAKQNISGMRIVKYFALPTTTTLIALFENKVVGTVSIIRRGSFGLPMDSAFDLSEFIHRNEVIAEISSLAIDKNFRLKRGAVFLPLLKYFWEYISGFMNVDSIVITVNPSMTDFYEAFLSFQRLKQSVVSSYSFANENPGVGLYLNVRSAPEIFKKLYNHKKSEKNLYKYFVDLTFSHFSLPPRRFFKSSDPVMTPSLLDYFFKKRSRVFAELTVTERLGLIAAYPVHTYGEVIPQLDLSTNRSSLRFFVNLKGFVSIDASPNMIIHDVAQEGICVTTEFVLTSDVKLTIQIGLDRFSKVRGEVKWQNKTRNMYGLSLVEVDSTWIEFVQYLRNDFELLNVDGIEKAS